MEASARPKHVYHFGLFRLDPESGTLLRQGVAIKLQDQSFRVLFLLLQRPGEIVSRDALREAIWPCGTYVEFDTNLNTILKRLRSALGDDADNPTFIETIPKRGYRFIAPVQSAQAPGAASGPQQSPVLEADSGEPEAGHTAASDALAAASNGIPRPAKAFWVRFTGWALAGCAAVAVLVALAHMYRAKRVFQAHAVVKAMELAPRPSVAIMEFQNASRQPENGWLSTAIPEMLSTELGADGKLRIISGEDVARMRRELQLESAGTLAKETAIRVGKNLKANLLVVGSYVVVGRTARAPLRIDLRIQDAATGEVVAEFEDSGNEKSLFDLISAAGTHVRERLGLPEISAEEEAGARALMPSNQDAARLYAKGLDLLRNYDPAGARDLLQEAVAAQPNFPLSHSALASAWKTLGYDEKARAEAKRAFDLSSNLPRPDRLLIKGRYQELSAHPDQAIATYRALLALFPDSVDDGLLLADAQASHGKPNQAFETITALRHLPSPLSDDPRIDIAEAGALSALGDYPHVLEAYRRAQQKAAAQGSSVLAAKAEMEECWGLREMGQDDQAMKLCEQSLPVFVQSGDTADQALATGYIGDIQYRQGKLTDAMESYRRALAIEQNAGFEGGMAITFNEMGIVREVQGDAKEAENLYRRSHELFVELAASRDAAILEGNVGDTLVEQGKLAEAEQLFEQSLRSEGVIGAKDFEAAAHANLAVVAFLRGRLQDARQHAEKAVAMHRESGQTFELSLALTQLADILHAQGELPQARHDDTESLTVAQKTGAKMAAAEAQLSLADIDLDQGHAAQVEQSIRDALTEFRSENLSDDELHALTSLSRCLLMQNKMRDAEIAIEQARSIAVHGRHDPERLLSFDIADARVKAARGKDGKLAGLTNEARSELLKCIGKARSNGYVEMEYEARLALAEVEIKSDPVAGKRYAASLAQDARAHGFGLVARRASALL